MQKYIKLSEYAKKSGINYFTAYRHFYKGYLDGKKLPTGTILIKDIETEDISLIKKEDKVAIYARVSSAENKNNLNKQVERMILYANAKGYKVDKIVKEIGSGLNDKRKKLEELLLDDSITLIIVEHKDRLVRFGLNYISILLNKLDKKIEIVNGATDEREDLMQDFIAIITSFCARLYGQRRNKRKTEKLIKELERCK